MSMRNLDFSPNVTITRQNFENLTSVFYNVAHIECCLKKKLRGNFKRKILLPMKFYSGKSSVSLSFQAYTIVCCITLEASKSLFFCNFVIFVFLLRVCCVFSV